MEELSNQLNFFDVFVVGTILVVGIFGIWLGFVSGSLYVLSWFGSGIAAFYGFPHTQPYAHEYIESEWLADAAAIFGAFLAALIVFVLFAAMIGAWIRRTQLNALDRSLGFLAGLVMGGFMICSGYVAFAYYVPPEDHPEWLLEAKSTPVIEEVSVELVKMIPEEWLKMGDDMLSAAAKPGEEASPSVLDGSESSRLLQQLLHPRPAAAPQDQQPGQTQPGQTQPGQTQPQNQEQGYQTQDRNELNRAVNSSPAAN